MFYMSITIPAADIHFMIFLTPCTKQGKPWKFMRGISESSMLL